MNSTETSYAKDSVAAPPKQRITDEIDKRFYITYDWNGNNLRAFVPIAPAVSGDVLLTTWWSAGPSADKLTWRL